MKFTIEGNRIVCSRAINSDVEEHNAIVDFDANLEVVPVHVEAKLSASEISALRTFLADRKKIHQLPADLINLEVLPEMIMKVVSILERHQNTDLILHRKLTYANDRLTKALLKTGKVGNEKRPELKVMDTGEAFRERLKIVNEK